MKQTLYILLIIAISLASCANNGDEPTPTPIPPNPPVVLSADAVLGIWETYYYTKAIRANPGTSSEVSYQGLRLIDYDGFKTEFYKSEDNTYRFKSVNVLNDLIDEGIYWVNGDTLKFKFEIKPGKDTLTWQKVRVFDSAKGILKTDASYWGTNNNKVKYIITDTKCQRNININPEYSDVNPAKVKIDFDYLAKTKWEVYSFAYYEGGQYRDRESTLGGDTLKGLTYRFYTGPTGERRCHLTQRIPGTDEWGEKDLPIVIVDDVISFVDVQRDSSGKIIEGTDDDSFFMWARDWKERFGVETFIDWKEERFQDDISVVIRTESFVRRVSD